MTKDCAAEKRGMNMGEEVGDDFWGDSYDAISQLEGIFG